MPEWCTICKEIRSIADDLLCSLKVSRLRLFGTCMVYMALNQGLCVSYELCWNR